MTRPINLRQIEAFKALIEHGTVSRAATVIHLSQPAVSKLIANLERTTELRLFDRAKGVLVPTETALQLYDEVDRIYGSVRQVENAIETVRRTAQGRLLIGVMPALAGRFIQHAVSNFLEDHEDVFCSIQARSSQWIIDGVVTRRLDLGLVESGLNHPDLVVEPLMERAQVCIMPNDHPLATKDVIRPRDLHDIPFLSVNPDSHPGHDLETQLGKHGIRPKISIIANLTTTLCELVAAGHGVSLVHPFLTSGLEHRLKIRKFRPEIPFNVQLCRRSDIRNTQIIDEFAKRLRATSAHVV